MSVVLFEGIFQQKQCLSKTSIEKLHSIMCDVLQSIVNQLVTVIKRPDVYLSGWTKHVFAGCIGRFYGRPRRPSASEKCPPMDRFLSIKSLLFSSIGRFCPSGQNSVHSLTCYYTVSYKNKNARKGDFSARTMDVSVYIKNHRIILR